ncbi:MAG: stalk domain-containing protein [Eubacteriales bacterium]|nr:stalk domain-containing protein [Eubacteriales bacterium]
MKRKLILILIVLTLLTSQFSYAFGYNNETGSLDTLQSMIINGLRSRETSIDIRYTGNSDDLKNVLSNIINFDEYLKYTIMSLRWEYTGYNGKLDINFSTSHLLTKAQEEYANQKIKEILARIIKPDMTIHEKIKAVHDWIVLNAKYDTSLTYRTHYDILSKGTAVCSGYALLFHRMANELKIPSKLVIGNAGEEHIWNMVYVDNQWYHIDATFDDPVPDQQGRLRHDFYMLTDDQISTTHTIYTENKPDSTVSYELLLNKLNQRTDDNLYVELINQLNLSILDEATLNNSIISNPLSGVVNVTAFDEYIQYDDSYGFPFIDNNDRTQVPFRITLEYFGAKVDWIPESNTAVAVLNGITVKIPIGKPYVLVNDELVYNDTISVIKNDRTYLPIRVVLESFGFELDWNSYTQTVIVKK